MKTAIITGASRGIGLAIAKRFAKEGYKLVLNSLHPGSVSESAAECCNNLSGAGCLPITGDVSDPVFVKELISAAAGYLGHIDVLVNNAGISYVGLIQDTDDDMWSKIINTNLSSVHYCTRETIPHMLKNGSGRIINVSSVWGNAGASCEAAYSASKGGVNAYTKAAAKELAPSGISVNAVACGCIKTDMLNVYSEDELNDLAEQIPIGRLGTPEEMAEIILKISEAPSYLTGQIITADGGWI